MLMDAHRLEGTQIGTMHIYVDQIVKSKDC
jgi:hypothetical protein